MSTAKFSLSAALVLAIAACAPAADEAPAEPAATDAAMLPEGPPAEIGEVAEADIPEALRAAALAKIPGMTIAEVQRKSRDGMVFFDVEGTRPDGSEVELDMLEENGAFRVVEVQRDIAWTEVPAEVRAVATATPKMFTPDRVIESVQNDGTVIYELFAPGKKTEPSAEISVKDGTAKMLTERWKY